MNTDIAHFFTLAMFYAVVPGAILSGVACIAWNARVFYCETSKRGRRKRLRRQFRAEYTAWKRGEKSHDGSAWIHASSAILIARSLRDLEV
jgi:hypothetical protein